MGLEPGNKVEVKRFWETERRWQVRKKVDVKRGGRS